MESNAMVRSKEHQCCGQYKWHWMMIYELFIAICNNVGKAAKIKNSRMHHCKPHKLVISSHIDMILSDLERYTKGLPQHQ